MIIANYSNVIQTNKSQLSPVINHLDKNLNKKNLKSYVNPDFKSDLNLYHFGGVNSLIKFIKNKFLYKNIIHVPIFHGTDLHKYSKDFNFLNRLKVELNFVANIILIYFCDYTYIVSENLLRKIPYFLRKKVRILSLGVDSQIIKKAVKKRGTVAFVNNNLRGIKNKNLAYLFCKKNDLNLIELSRLSHQNFLKKISSSEFLILTSFEEGSPNVIKEAILSNTKIITVDVGDALSQVSRFGGRLIDYNGKTIKIFEKSNNYSFNYLDISNTTSQIVNDAIYFKKNEK